MLQRDPLEYVRRLLVDNDFADASELKKLEKVGSTLDCRLHTAPARRSVALWLVEVSIIGVCSCSSSTSAAALGARRVICRCRAVQTIKKEVDNAVATAKQSSIPDPSALWKTIYRDTLGSVMKGLDSRHGPSPCLRCWPPLSSRTAT